MELLFLGGVGIREAVGVEVNVVEGGDDAVEPCLLVLSAWRREGCA